MLRHLICMMLTFLFPNLVAGSGLAPRAPIQINFPDFPPYYFFDDKGQRTGITTETLTLCLNRIKRPFIFVDLPIERMQVGMQDGSLDIHTYSYHKGRESFVTFGHEALFRTEYRPFVRADANITIKKISDFDPLRLGHILGLRYSPEFMKYVERRRLADTIDEATSTEQNFRKLLAGRIDIFVNAVEPAQYAAQRLGYADKVKALDWVAHDGIYYMAVSNNSRRIPDRAAFLREMDGCLQQIKKQGTFCGLYKNYGLACPRLPDRG